MRRLFTVIMALALLCTSVAQASTGIDRKQFPKVLKGEHFQVFYAVTGPEAVPEAYAGRTLIAAEAAYERLVTRGGFRPPRMLPVPIVLESAEEGLGGRASGAFRGFEAMVQINPKMSALSLEDVVAHEFVHVLQNAYDKGMTMPVWAIEGTAPVGSLYALGSDAAKLGDWGHLNMYWVTHTTPMKEMDYAPSLFWYVTAEHYGGLAYLRRLFEWSEDVDWERAAQLAAIQGGAPPTATFDTLWRSFVFDLLGGRVPEGYITEVWLQPTDLTWNGQHMHVVHGDEFKGAGPLGQPYSYFEPLQLGPYSFDLVEIQHRNGDPLALTVVADDKVVEAYVIKPGTPMAKALQRKEGRPDRGSRGPVPSGEGTVGARFTIGTPIRLQSNDSTLVVLMRLGAWGSGTYSLKLQPADATVEAPKLTPLRDIPPGPDSAGSPPRLTQSELAALKAGTWAAGAAPLEAKLMDMDKYRTVYVSVGEPIITVNGDPYSTKVAAVAGKDGEPPLVPLRQIARLLGWTVDGWKIRNGDQWIEVQPGDKQARGPNRYVPFRRPAVAAGDEILAEPHAFSLMDCDISYSRDWVQLIYPRP